MPEVVEAPAIVTSRVERKFTVKRDKYDPRDLVVVQTGPQNLPAVFTDLNQYAGPVKDQGNEGACTGFTGDEMVELLIRKYYHWIPGLQLIADDAQRLAAAKSVILSPQFVYYNERMLDGDINQDNGSSGRTMMQSLTKFGVCLESLMPYKDTDWATAPSKEAYDNGLFWKPGAYHRVPDAGTAKTVLFSGYPVSISVEVYSSFMSAAAAKTGIIPMPGPREVYEGGHEIWLWGWDDTLEFGSGVYGGFLGRNHWGMWGDRGNFKIPYAYIDNKQLTSDMWTVHFGKPWRGLTLAQHHQLQTA